MMGETQCRGAVLSAGLVLENSFYKYLLLEKGLSGVRVVKTISQRLDTAGKDVYGRLFCHLAESRAPKDVPIAFALRFDESLIKIIDMQFLSVEDVKLTLRYQFEDYFPFTVKESNYDVQEIEYPGADRQEKRFMAAVCRARVIREIKAESEKMGFKLSCVEPSQVSFERAITPAGRAENLIGIYAGTNDLLFILSNGKNGIFYRNAVVRQEGRQYIEAAASEIRASLEIARHNIPCFREKYAVIAGANASETLCRAAAKILGHANVRVTNPFDGCAAAPGALADSEMILPFGAALRQV